MWRFDGGIAVGGQDTVKGYILSGLLTCPISDALYPYVCCTCTPVMKLEM